MVGGENESSNLHKIDLLTVKLFIVLCGALLILKTDINF